LFSIRQLAAALLVTCVPALASAQATAALESTVQIISPRALTANQASAFDEFIQDGRYNGAFFVASNGGYNWRVNINTIEAAKLVAKQACNLNGPNCQIYAILTPKKARLTKHIEGLSQGAAIGAENWVRENAAKGIPTAVAAGAYTGWGGWRGKRGKAALQKAAVNHCGDKMVPRVERLEPRLKNALEDAGFLKCKIVITHFPR